MWKEVRQLVRVTEIRADVAQPIPQQSESIWTEASQTEKLSSRANILIMSTFGQREQHLDTFQSSQTRQPAAAVDDGK